MKKWVIWIIVAIVLILAMIALAYFSGNEEEIVCTADAKECPDGSYVGRNPDLNCEFNPCPAKRDDYCKMLTREECDDDTRCEHVIVDNDCEDSIERPCEDPFEGCVPI